MATSQVKHKRRPELLLVKMAKELARSTRNCDQRQIQDKTKAQTEHFINQIIAKKISIPVSYEDPVPVLNSYMENEVVTAMVDIRLDYKPSCAGLLKIKHFSDWMLSIFLGNYTDFIKMIDNMTKEELEQHLKMRETALRCGALFHVVLGAMDCIPGSSRYFGHKSVHGKVESEHLKILEKLLELGADVNALDVTGCEALFHAATFDPFEQEAMTAIAKVLIEHGARVNTNEKMKRSVLHPFIVVNHLDIVKLLIKYGANPYVLDKRGLTAFDYASNGAGIKLVSSLLKFNRKEIIQEQLKAVETQNYKKCGVCMKPSSKKCAGCQMEWYCSVGCQKQHWVEHGSICRERQAEYQSVWFVPDRLESELGGVPCTADCIVSVHLNVLSNTTMAVYDEKLRIVGKIVANDDGFGAKLMKIVKRQGFKGFKGYFNAKKRDDQIMIHPKILPPQIW